MSAVTRSPKPRSMSPHSPWSATCSPPFSSSAGWSRFLDVDPEVQDRYNVTLQKKLQQTVFLSGCKSWYLNRQGRNTTLFPGLTWRYRRATAQFNVNDYVWSPAGHRQSAFSEEELKV